ncbi:hypothetical protein CC1G_06141 [Coprinopsis cinerea okayama7|uniref:F-box domain-containing protein n=1 Tax=Coprinopsis cinerea (strain Okayama-7 / 130 / ATCC MYA-4618 / FGSC 9003) TaxID=240176 RepID=A8PAB2_COPC7|nr:hypothetical protein CC1G_06141 [Coprinopsis cinerea okayama7\|eukprot:XP_001839951.2 hypothetical protein CC1G_06141 [Coprinopsis cinerea okayama7\
MEAPSIVIPEILHQIVDYVVEYEPFLSGRRHKRLQLQSAATLVALASTSRIFSEIAVRTIWESIPHLGVVLALIPEDARQIQIELPSESLLTEYTLEITRDLGAKDLCRIIYYAPFIKEIGRFGSPSVPENSFDVPLGLVSEVKVKGILPTIQRMISPSQPLFPNVTAVQCDAISLRAASGDIRLLNVASLRRLDANLTHQLRFLSTCNEAIININSKARIHSLALAYPGEDTPMADAPVLIPIQTLLLNFEHLVELATGKIPIGTGVLNHLAQLPTLRRLDMWLAQRWQIAALGGKGQFNHSPETSTLIPSSKIPCSRPFPSLQTLIIRTFSLPDVIELVIPLVATAPLSTLKTEFYVTGQEEGDVTPKIDPFVEGLSLPRLEHLSVTSRGHYKVRYYRDTRFYVTPETLEPLRRLNGLRTLAISPGVKVGFVETPDNLDECRKHWPHMSHIVLE